MKLSQFLRALLDVQAARREIARLKRALYEVGYERGYAQACRDKETEGYMTNTGPMRPLKEETDPLVRLVKQAQYQPGALARQHYRTHVLPDRPTEHGQAVRWPRGE